MATTQPKSGVTEYTTTTGTGPVTLTGAATGYRGFVSADDGKVYHYAIRQAGTTFEVGVGTYDHDSRQLTRTTIKANKDGTTNPLNLGAGTKEVSIVLPAELTAMLDSVGEWAADQHWNGYRQYLDADQDSWIDCATDDVLKAYLNAILVLQMSSDTLTLFGTDDTASEGPLLVLRRDSASPAASDVLGGFYIQGKDGNGTTQSAFRARASWTAVTAGAHASQASFSIAKAGAFQIVLVMVPDAVSAPAGVDIFTGGKTSRSFATNGCEIRENGVLVASSNEAGGPCYINRNSTDGTLLNFTRDGGSVATITVSAGTVTYNTFTGGHWSEWKAGQEGEEQLGTVVATADGLFEHPSNQLPLIRAAIQGDPCVYGVISARLPGGADGSFLLVNGLGLGRIRCIGEIQRGDLLRVSATPGVAEAQSDDIVRSTTIAKATQNSPDNGGERLVPCVLMAG